MMQQDSIQHADIETLEASSQEASSVRHDGYHSPREIISWLPRTATPWQQDSAIRANYKFPEVDWTKAHNPMCTPQTHADAPSGFSLDKPMYHGRSLVQPDSIYRPEYAVYRQGVAGDPVPYTIGGDNLITSILLGCFVFATVAVAKSGNFLQRQLKNFFRTQREGTTVITETSSELRFQLFLVLQTCLLFALIFFFRTNTFGDESFTIPQYLIIGTYTGIMAVYFLLKALLYAVVDWVFFEKKKNEQWMKSALFLASTEGLALFPVVMLLAYFGFSIEGTVVYTMFVIILVKLLAFYKTFIIFFRKSGVFLQSFLYFCALELMPLGALWGALVLTDSYLKINF